MLKYILLGGLIFLIARIVVISKRTRNKKKNRGTPTAYSRPYKVFEAYISNSTPTNCILKDGKKYGEDFSDKIPPALCPGCQCDLKDGQRFSFSDLQKMEKVSYRQTDLGELSGADLKYYKYFLLSEKKDIDEEMAKYYVGILEKISVTEQFKNLVRQKLRPENTSSPEE